MAKCSCPLDVHSLSQMCELHLAEALKAWDMAENEDRLANLQGQDPETLNPVTEAEALAIAEACAHTAKTYTNFPSSTEDAAAATRGEVRQLRDENHIVLCHMRDLLANHNARIAALENAVRALVALASAERRAA